MPKSLPKAPSGLRPETAKWWRTLVRDFDFEPHQIRTLEGACRAWDRAENARDVIESEGAIVHDRWGQAKQHPACAIERDFRGLYARLLRELALDVEMPGEGGRPPRLPGARR